MLEIPNGYSQELVKVFQRMDLQAFQLILSLLGCCSAQCNY